MKTKATKTRISIGMLFVLVELVLCQSLTVGHTDLHQQTSVDLPKELRGNVPLLYGLIRQEVKFLESVPQGKYTRSKVEPLGQQAAGHGTSIEFGATMSVYRGRQGRFQFHRPHPRGWISQTFSNGQAMDLGRVPANVLLFPGDAVVQNHLEPIIMEQTQQIRGQRGYCGRKRGERRGGARDPPLAELHKCNSALASLPGAHPRGLVHGRRLVRS